MRVTTENYKGTPCLLLSNGTVEVRVSTMFGPRILFYGFAGGQNFFQVFEEQIARTNRDDWKAGGQQAGEWQIYGGHRLWLSPEVRPRTYYPDNSPVTYTQTDATVTVTAPVETATGIQKIIEISIPEHGSEVRLNHRLVNHNVWGVELAVWSLSVMHPGGRVVIPHEEYQPHPDALAPARPLVLWPYTNMSDPRFTWGRKYIHMSQDDTYSEKLKIGVCNTRGYEGYILGSELFIKHHSFIAGATYPDMGCNAEFFTMPKFLEMETLSPLRMLLPGDEMAHQERWELRKTTIGGHRDEEMDAIFAAGQ